MARLLRMPEVAANATEAVLADWSVAESGAFDAQDTLATVETEKALVDVEADRAGVVLKTLVPPGAQVQVGAPIAVLGDPGEQVADLDALLTELGVAGPDASVDHVTRVFASPLARRLARDAGIPVEQIDGTGPRHRILRRDVERVAAERVAAERTVPTPAASAAYEDLPHSRIRRTTAARLVESKRTAPHFYLRATIRVGRLLALRAELNEGADISVSVNDLVVKAAGAAHRRVPEMNVVWTEDAVRSFRTVDLAVAVATERGLVTPVVRDVTSLSVTALAARVKDLVARARTGQLRQEELEGGTMSVTNLGMFGTEEFAAVINPPQASILAVGAVREEPVVEGGALVVGQVMRVTLSVDHRPVDGVVAARWMQAFVDLMEHPARILA